MRVGVYNRCMGANPTITAVSKWPEEFDDVEAFLFHQPCPGQGPVLLSATRVAAEAFSARSGASICVSSFPTATVIRTAASVSKMMGRPRRIVWSSLVMASPSSRSGAPTAMRSALPFPAIAPHAAPSFQRGPGEWPGARTAIGGQDPRPEDARLWR